MNKRLTNNRLSSQCNYGLLLDLCFNRNVVGVYLGHLPADL